MKSIILTGGGTAGHVTPNIALLPRLRATNYTILISAPPMVSRRPLSKHNISPIMASPLENFAVTLV